MLRSTSSDSSNQAPGPTGLDIARWFYRIRENTFEAFVALSREYGDVARIPFMPGRNLYLCSTPEAAKHVLQDNHRNYKKAITYSFLKPVVGEGLLTSEGDMWLRQRRLVAPIFHRRRIESYATIMEETIDEMMTDWAAAGDGSRLDVSEAMSKLTLSIAGKLLFNQDIGRDAAWIGDAMVLLFRDVNRRILSPLSVPRKVPTPHNRRIQGALDQLEELVYGLIDERTGREEDFDDLLSMFMLAEDKDTGKRMSKKEIRDELMTFLIAGHDTTSNLLSWGLYLLSKNPEIRRRLEKEVAMVCGDDRPGFAHVKEMDYLEEIIDEVMRLYPPAWTVEREPIEDDEISGYHIEAGSIVSIGPYFVHHNPNVWENPEGFDPGRFGRYGNRPEHRYAHFPFGGGPRMCVGADFAILEAKLILATIAQRFRLDLVPGHTVEPEGTVTLYPKSGIPMTVICR